VNLHEEHLAQLLSERKIIFKRQVAGLVPGRKYTCDFLVPSIPAVVELQGGIWRKGKGAHSRPQNIERDCEKSNLLQIEGYMVYKIPTSWLSGERFEKLTIVLDFLVFAQDAAKRIAAKKIV